MRDGFSGFLEPFGGFFTDLKGANTPPLYVIKNEPGLTFFIFWCEAQSYLSPVLTVSFSPFMEKSQNHRMSWMETDLERSSCPILRPGQEHLDQVTQECVQEGFECLQTSNAQLFTTLPITHSGFAVPSIWWTQLKAGIACCRTTPLPSQWHEATLGALGKASPSKYAESGIATTSCCCCDR